MNIKSLLLLIVILIFTGSIIAFMGLSKNGDTSTNTNGSVEAESQDVRNSEKIIDAEPRDVDNSEKIVEKSTPTPKTSVLECGNSLNCLVEASKSCKKAKAKNTITLDLFGIGVDQTTTTFYEIKGSQGEGCLLYLRIENIDLSFPPSVPQDIVSEQNDLYDQLEGRDGSCNFNEVDLTRVLTNWSKGNFATGKISCELSSDSGAVCDIEGGDFGNAQCSGSYFSNEL